ncbi:MDR family MFS transporter [Paenibacillus sp. IITD108]|uniref:MDR family MFS transporter n=1 Tax=Paenibacillus sp. IITD108 TaxID=3116649 RepID=UPI003FA6D038
MSDRENKRLGAVPKKYEFLSQDPSVKVMPIVISLIIGAFFAMLNETLLNIALKTLMAEFDISITTVQWMATGFMLVMGMVIPVSAVMMQWFTTRQMFLGTLIIFTIGTIICAAAPDFSLLLAGRFMQAVGTGLLTPVIFNIFLLLYPPEKRGAMLGLVGLVFMFAPAIGPTLSGVIVEYLGWRYLFIIVIPFMIFSILFAFKYLVNISEITKPKVDIASIILSMAGFGTLVYGFSSAGEAKGGFTNPVVLGSIIIGIILLTIFSIRQLKLKEPLLDLNVFKYPMFRLGAIVFVLVMMAMLSSEIILPLFMQGPLGLAAATAGLVLLPGSILNGLMSPVMGKLFDKFGPRVLMVPASILLALTLLMFSFLSANTPPWQIVVGYILLMLSVSAMFMPSETNALNQLPKSMYTHGTAVLSTLQPVAGAIGVSVFVGLMSARQNYLLEQSGSPESPLAQMDSFVGGVRFVYIIGFALAVLTFFLALRMRRSQPAVEEEKAVDKAS